METDVYLAKRFDRLRQIIKLRNEKIQGLDKQVLELFEVGNIEGIETLMNKKQDILETNHRLALFIDKWENQSSNWLREQLYTSL